MSSRRHSAPVLKDSYGFVVKRDHHELFKQYAPIWAKEEVERTNLWSSFLLSFAEESAREEAEQSADKLKAASKAGLEPFKQALAGWHAVRDSADGAKAEMPDWLPQLRCLVQAGIPKALRGKLWQIFLGLDAKHEPGLYDQYVQKALGSTKYGRKRNRATGDLEGAVPGHDRTAASSTRSADQSSSDAESMSAYAPAAASLPRRTDSSDGETHSAAAAPAADAAPAAKPPPVRAQRTPSFSGMSASGSESGRRSRSSAEPWHPSTNDWNVQIEKDLHRTFPGHPLMNRRGRGALRRTLAAYSRRNDAVGYCQGMNFIAGVLLLFMSEEEAFWALTAVVEDILPGYFALDLIAPQVDQLVFKHMVDQRFPTLCSHLTKHGVNVASMALNWYLTCFVTSLPLESALRVWDVLFFDRCASVLFRCGLALVDIYAQALVATVDSIDAHTLLHAMAPMSFDASRLIDMACIAFANLTMDQIQALRKAYNTTVVASKMNESSEDEDAAWENSDDDVLSVDDDASTALDSPTGPAGSGDYYSGSDDEDSQASDEEAVTPTRLAELDAQSKERSDSLEDIRRYVDGIPSNELLSGSSAAGRDPKTPAHPVGASGRADLSPVDEVSTSAEKPSPSPAGARLSASPQVTEQQQQQQAAAAPSDGGLGAASAAASAISRRLHRIASAHKEHVPPTRRLFGRRKSGRKAAAAPGAAVLAGTENNLPTKSMISRTSAAAEAAYHIAVTPFKTPPRARLVPGDTPITGESGMNLTAGGDVIATEAGVAREDSPTMTTAVADAPPAASAVVGKPAPPGSAAERARRHIEAASNVVARTIGDAFGGRSRMAEDAKAVNAEPGGRHAAAMAQLLSVVEGLEEELFAAEAACHEAEVEASVADRHAADARKELSSAVAELQEKAGMVDLLHDKLLGVNNTLAFFDSELQTKEKMLASIKAQVAERDQQIAHKDALIASLLQQQQQQQQQHNGKGGAGGSASANGAPAGGFFSKLRTSVARSPSVNGEAQGQDSPAATTPTGGRMWSRRPITIVPDEPADTRADAVGAPAAAAEGSAPIAEGSAPAADAAAAASGDGTAGAATEPLDPDAAAEAEASRLTEEIRRSVEGGDAAAATESSAAAAQKASPLSESDAAAAAEASRLTAEIQKLAAAGGVAAADSADA